MKEIIVNKARCKLCGDIIVSEHRHDFKTCSCKAISVDGGNDYIRRVGKMEYLEELSEYKDEVLDEKVEIIIKLLEVMVKVNREDALILIKQTETYEWMIQEDYKTNYLSPQANLESMGRELRERGNVMGTYITADNIRKAMVEIMDESSKEMGKTEGI